MEKLYSISDVADKLGLSTKTLRRWEETGKFVGTRTLGGQRRYTVTDLQILDAIKHGTIPDSSDLLTIDQAAALFGVTPTTIVRWEDAGKIHPLITAGVTYYPRHKLLENREMLKALTPYQEPVFQPVNIPTPPPRLVHQTPVPPPPPRVVTRPTMAVSTPLPSTFSPLMPSVDNLKYLAVIAINSVITLTMLGLYHRFFVVQTPIAPEVNQGSVQGAVDAHDELLSILDSIIDTSGNLRTQSISTPKLSLSPGAPPAKAIPGSMYFDAGVQKIKVYVNGSWHELAFVESQTVTASPAASPSATLKSATVR